MHGANRDRNALKKLLLTVPVFLILPLIIAFDSLIYLFTRPACLNCGNLLEFLKNASLTVFILSSVGYQLGKRK